MGRDMEAYRARFVFWEHSRSQNQHKQSVQSLFNCGITVENQKSLFEFKSEEIPNSGIVFPYPFS